MKIMKALCCRMHGIRRSAHGDRRSAQSNCLNGLNVHEFASCDVRPHGLSGPRLKQDHHVLLITMDHLAQLCTALGMTIEIFCNIFNNLIKQV